MSTARVAGDHQRMRELAKDVADAAESTRGLARAARVSGVRLVDGDVWSDSGGQEVADRLRAAAAHFERAADGLEQLASNIIDTAKKYELVAKGGGRGFSSAIDESRPGPLLDHGSRQESHREAAGVQDYVPPWDPEGFQGVGDPVGLAGMHRAQEGEDTCAVVCQTSIMRSLDGWAPDEAVAVSIAHELGIYSPGEGTSRRALGGLLEHYGVATDGPRSSSIEELAQGLAAGKRVLVAVNANQIWRPQRDAGGGVVRQIPPAGHAVWVTGIDMQSGEWTVIVNDPGRADGAMRPIALDDFIAAWDDFDRTAVFAGG